MVIHLHHKLLTMVKTLKHDIKADFLLERGIALLWSKGYNATSVNDIVKAAEIPKGSFYFYFKSKEDFAVQAIEKYFNDQFPMTLEVLLDASFSPKQRLLNFYEFRAEYLKKELKNKMGCMGCNLAAEMAEHNEAIRTVLLCKGNWIKEHITAVIKEAQEQGELNNETKASDLAEFMEDAAKGAMITMKEMDSSYPIDNFLTMVQRVLLK